MSQPLAPAPQLFAAAATLCHHSMEKPRGLRQILYHAPDPANSSQEQEPPASIALAAETCTAHGTFFASSVTLSVHALLHNVGVLNGHCVVRLADAPQSAGNDGTPSSCPRCTHCEAIPCTSKTSVAACPDLHHGSGVPAIPPHPIDLSCAFPTLPSGPST